VITNEKEGQPTAAMVVEGREAGEAAEGLKTGVSANREMALVFRIV
jgi:hypothetical protein